MELFKIKALSVGGRGNKVYKSGEMVDSNAFHHNQIEELIQKGFIERAGKAINSKTYSPRQFESKGEKALILNFADAHQNVFSGIEKLIYDKIKYDSTYDDSVIVLGYNVMSYDAVRSQYPESRLIIYQLEQLAIDGNMWWNSSVHGSTVKKWIENCDEIWDYSIENIEFLQRQGVDERKIKYKPIEYCDGFVVDDYDVLFYGFLNERRLQLLTLVAEKFKTCIIGIKESGVEHDQRFQHLKIIPPKHGEDLWGYIKRSKVVLNIHFYEIQEVVRMSELIANNITVLSEKSRINYYDGLIDEFETADEMIQKLSVLIQQKPKKRQQSFKNQIYPERRVFNPNGFNVLSIDTLSNRFKLFEKETLNKLDDEFGIFVGEKNHQYPWVSFGRNFRTLLKRSFETQDWAIVIEDDAAINQKQLDKMKLAIKQLNDAGIEWDVIFGCVADFPEGKIINKPFKNLDLYQTNYGISTVFNAYNKSVMKTVDLWDETELRPENSTFDSDLGKAAKRGELKAFCFFPFIASCLKVPSTVWHIHDKSLNGYQEYFTNSSKQFTDAINKIGKKTKMTIYTSFTEGYDEPRTDVKFIAAENGRYENKAKDAGRVKHLFWQYDIKTPFNMWVDGSIYPLNDADDYIKLLGDADICLFKHPWRDCIYDECDETLRLDFDLPEIALPQIERYRKEGYPAHNGLHETGVLIRRNTPRVRAFFTDLWQEIENGSHRDQLAWNYVLSKHPKLKIKTMPPSVRNHPMFKMIGHKKHMTKVGNQLIDKAVR